MDFSNVYNSRPFPLLGYEIILQPFSKACLSLLKRLCGWLHPKSVTKSGALNLIIFLLPIITPAACLE